LPAGLIFSYPIGAVFPLHPLKVAGEGQADS